MNQFLLVMHTDTADPFVANDPARWDRYLERLKATGRFDGGSELAGGVVVRRGRAPAAPISAIDGFIQVRAESLDEAKGMVEGNPVYEAGGSVEIREMPKSDG